MIRWLLVLCFLCVASVRAEEVDLLAPETVTEENSEPVITDKSSLPDCNNETLKEQVRVVIKEYNDRNHDVSLIARRHQALQLRFLSDYSEERVSGFTAKQNREVADTLVMTKINNGLTDGDIRLCKSKGETRGFKPVYVLMYRDKNDLVKVLVLNYVEKSQEKLSFVF